jgi:hypothetical protein
MMNIATPREINDRAAEYMPTIYVGVERRRKPRIEGHFPALVHGVDAGGEAFELQAVIDNISAVGLYVRLKQRVEPGTTLFFLTSLSRAERVSLCAPRLALHGVALRAELTPAGGCGVAVALSHHRFL